MSESLWIVERHSGIVGSGWRRIYAGEEKQARASYAAVATALRQGGVKLIRPDGQVDSEVGAPRLRTRW